MSSDKLWTGLIVFGLAVGLVLGLRTCKPPAGAKPPVPRPSPIQQDISYNPLDSLYYLTTTVMDTAYVNSANAFLQVDSNGKFLDPAVLYEKTVRGTARQLAERKREEYWRAVDTLRAFNNRKWSVEENLKNLRQIPVE